MEIVYYTLVAAGLYFMSDWVLQRLETARGAPFKHRHLAYFAIILTLAMLTFGVIRVLMVPSDEYTPPPVAPQNNRSP